MLGRPGHLHVVAVLYAQALVVVARGAVGVRVVAVEAHAFQCRGYEAEVALVAHLHAEYACVVCVHVLLDGEHGAVAAQAQLLAGVIAYGLNVHVLYVLVEEAQAHQSDALEVVLGGEVVVERRGRLYVRVAYHGLLVGQVERLVGYEGGVLRARERLGERGAYAEVVVHPVLQQHARQQVGVVVLVLAGGVEALAVNHFRLAVLVEHGLAGAVKLLLFPRLVVESVGFQRGVLHAQADGGVELAAQFLVEADVAGCYLLVHIVVAGLLFEHLFAPGRVELQPAEELLAQERRPHGVETARHEAVAHLV